MKRRLQVSAMVGCTILLSADQAMALSSETDMLFELLKTKGVVTENDVRTLSEALDKQIATREQKADQHHHSVQSLNQRLEKLEHPATEEGGLPGNKIRMSGVVEVEATASSTTDSSGTDTDESDVSLATAEIDFDTTLTENVEGHLSFLYEEGEEDGHVVIDEGFITLSGRESFPVYMKVGKMYLPFGSYESHFITDPTTVTLGESNDTAVVTGYANRQIDLSAGVFRGGVKEAGKDDRINSFVGGAVYTLPENTLPGLDLRAGASYLSNLATGNTLQGLTATAGEVIDTVSGVSGFVSLSLQERFFFAAEYLGALDDFTVTDFTFTDADNRRPTAWNVEVAAAFMPKLELALKLEGSDEFGNEAPEKQYGAALLYSLVADTSITFEYLHGEFADNSDRNQATLQLAIEF